MTDEALRAERDQAQVDAAIHAVERHRAERENLRLREALTALLDSFPPGDRRYRSRAVTAAFDAARAVLAGEWEPRDGSERAAGVFEAMQMQAASERYLRAAWETPRVVESVTITEPAADG